MVESVNPGDDGSATSTAHAATINHTGGVITTESLTTAASAVYTMNVTDSNIQPGNVVVASVSSGLGNGSNTRLPVYVASVDVATTGGSANINIVNGATSALNGTLVVSYVVL